MKFMARNTYQILGLECNEPSNLVICWTPGGRITGGTGQALRMAKAYGIKVLNLAIIKPENIQKRLNQFIETREVVLPTIVSKKATR